LREFYLLDQIVQEGTTMNGDKRKSQDNPLSSRIKKIFIELHDYAFFHGPSEISMIDRRFIGRTENKNKLKAILTNNETRTGAYLVTGYRGMGKSSYVSKVIDEIDSSTSDKVLASIHRRIIVILLLLLLLDALMPLNFPVLTMGAALISWIILVATDIIGDGRKHKKSVQFLRHLGIFQGKFWKHFWNAPFKTIKDYWKISLPRRLLLSFFLADKMCSETLFRQHVQVLFISSFIYSFSHLTLPIFKYNLGLAIFSLYVVFVLCHYLYRKIKFEKLSLSEIPGDIFHKVKDCINYSKRHYVKLNLGYDDLKEIDILRLIAKSVQRELGKLRRFRLPERILKTIKVLLVFLLTGFIYYSGPIYDMNENFRKATGISDYFPSQDFSMSAQEKIEYEKEGPKPTITGGVSLKHITTYLDSLIHIAYFQVRDIFSSSSGDKYKPENHYLPLLNINDRFKLPPERVDYIFWLYFVFIYLLINRIISFAFKLPSQKSILSKLKNLNEMIDSQVTDEVESETGVGAEKVFAFSRFRKRQKAYPRADIREIEKRLISILEEIDQYGRFSAKTEFIFIFDELDKIEPNLNITLQEREKEKDKSSYQPETTFFSTEGVRGRQHTIFKILSNLKHFLNTAKGKFIFIAGREMYDAALADVSDRNFFIGSIFHNVIYIPSFLTDTSDRQSSNLLSMTEEYVCQFLFPPFEKVVDYNLNEYKRYLQNFLFKSDKEKWLKEAKIDKIIFTLRHFILYLTYRSNGAPKKMTSFFEKFIYKPERGKYVHGSELESPFSLRVGFNNRNLYLEFDEYHQYAFSMISYLITPVMLSVGDAVKDYGDKLLVSTTFLVDHLYKFHKNAFSWRNIEMTPEILDFNKAPQLRDLITMIIHNLANSHLTDIVSGLYVFKFYKKISEEISFLSKIDEQEAAAFNFTLDESLALKRHYKKKLDDVKRNQMNKESKGSLDFINSLSFIHMVIGDFHFHDEEYNEAILEYMQAVKGMREKEFDQSNASLFIVFIRNMLKLGLALEKRKSYDSASMIYGELIQRIVNFVTTDQVEMNKKRGLLEKFRITFKKQVKKNGRDALAQGKSTHSSFEGVRLIYQPLLARLHIIEKSRIGGVTKEELTRLKEDFNAIGVQTEHNERFLVEVEFWSKVGDLLYFKNSKRDYKAGNTANNCPDDGALCYCSEFKIKIKAPCGACQFYMRSLDILCREYLKISAGKIKEKKVLPAIADKLSGKTPGLQDAVANRVTARVLSAIGDCYYSCAKSSNPVEVSGFLKEYFIFIEKTEEEKGELNASCEIAKALFYYYLSYKFYFKAGNQKQASVQILKILYLIRNLLFSKGSDGTRIKDNTVLRQTLKANVKTVLFKRGLRTLYRAYGNIHRLEIEDYKKIFADPSLDTPLGKQFIELKHISLSTDLREYIMVTEEILLECGEYDLSEMTGEFIRRHSITPYSSINRMYNRIIDLKFKAKILFKIFKYLGFEEFLKAWTKVPSPYPHPKSKSRLVDILEEKIKREFTVTNKSEISKMLRKEIFNDEDVDSVTAALEFLISDSIYCHHEIIKLVRISGLSYMVNHSLLADTHKKLGDWCKYFLLYCKCYKWSDKKEKKHILGFRKRLEKLIGMDNLQIISPRYHYEKAREAYYAIEELHGGGKVYRDFTRGMYYLNDDFNDSWYHFSAAEERYRINTGRIKSFKDGLKKELKGSSLYEFENYIGKDS
jgi:hypothetical protein